MTTAVQGVEGWLSQVDQAMQAVPSALRQTAPSGQFATVLGSVQRAIAQGASPGAQSGAAQPTGAGVVAQAEQYLGTPYQWGGTSPSGFDCSGLVQYVFGQLGVSLPRTSQEQAAVGTPVPSLAQAQPGDLVFFAGSDGTASSPGHVGIYVGNGEMIDAPFTGAAVRVDPVGDPVAIRRVLPAGAGTGGTPGTAGSLLAGGIMGTGAGLLAGGIMGSGAGLLAGGVLGTALPAGPGGATTAGGTSPVPASLAPLFVAAAGANGLPASLLVAVARQESNFSPGAVSSAGAQGIMQLTPQTAAGLGVDPMDPAQAIDGAARLLAGYVRQYGSVPLALAAYNAGPAAVARYGGIPPYPETQQYVSSIMSSLGVGS